MAKASREKPTKVEIQKGPIRLEESYTENLSAAKCLMEDLHNAFLRTSMQTLTLHEPKK